MKKKSVRSLPIWCVYFECNNNHTLVEMCYPAMTAGMAVEMCLHDYSHAVIKKVELV